MRSRRHIAAWLIVVALGASSLAYSAPGGGGIAESAEAGWTNGFDLASVADGDALFVVDRWTNGHDLPSGGDNTLSVAAK